jgi:hypothetical protein
MTKKNLASLKTAAGREARQDQIDNAVALAISRSGKKRYGATYDEALRRIKSGQSAETIRSTLIRKFSPRPHEPGEKIAIYDRTEIDNDAERILIGIETRAVEDALIGQDGHYQPPAGYS